MIKLYAKIGTHPATYVWIYRRRAPPAVGEHVVFRDTLDDERARRKHGVVDLIKEMPGGEPLFYIGLM
jgi:hypothetical protein